MPGRCRQVECPRGRGDHPGVLEVLDEGRGFNAHDLAPSGTDERGRGLLIVDRLASRWGVGYGPGARVGAELALPRTATLAVRPDRRMT